MAVAIYSFCFPLVKLRCLFHLLLASRALRNAIQLKKFPPIPPSLFELEQATGFLPSIWPLSANSIWPCVRSGRIRMALFLLLIIPTLFSPITFSMQILSVGRQRHFLVLILRPWSVHDVVSCQNFLINRRPMPRLKCPPRSLASALPHWSLWLTQTRKSKGQGMRPKVNDQPWVDRFLLHLLADPLLLLLAPSVIPPTKRQPIASFFFNHHYRFSDFLKKRHLRGDSASSAGLHPHF